MRLSPIAELVSLCDAVLFYVQVARLRTRPVTIRESEGCVTLTCKQVRACGFPPHRLLELMAAGHQVDLFTIQESIAA
jgi:hypothetical protein